MQLITDGFITPKYSMQTIEFSFEKIVHTISYEVDALDSLFIVSVYPADPYFLNLLGEAFTIVFVTQHETQFSHTGHDSKENELKNMIAGLIAAEIYPSSKAS